MGTCMYLAMYLLNNNSINKITTNLLIVITVWMKIIDLQDKTMVSFLLV